ncbi:hypothetical protein ACUOFC_36015, partial [Escherichia sp. TWPC-MK]
TQINVSQREWIAPDVQVSLWSLFALLNRIIAVGHQHHLNVVGWNPGPALSVSMGDMPDDGYKTFVCVETAYASETQKVTKEKPAHLAQSIRVAKR